MQRSKQSHQRIRELLPWYVTGTLEESEMDLVSAHLEQCAECARAVGSEISLSQRVREQPLEMDTLLAKHKSAFAALQTSLSNGANQPSTQAGRGLGIIRRGPVLATAVLLLVAGVSFLTGRASLDPTYEAMTSSQDDRPGYLPGHEGAVIQLIFHPSTSEQDIRQLLVDGGGSLLGNPSEKGVYRIGLPARTDAVKYAARLKSHPAIRWAEVELQ